jgi:transposase
MKKGLRPREIARELDVTEQLIYYYKRKKGLEGEAIEPKQT